MFGASNSSYFPYGDSSNSSHIPTFDTIPIFNGGSGYWWIICLWKFWNSKDIPESQRLKEVYHGLRGEALRWFILWRLKNPTLSWMHFKNAFLQRYQPDFRPIISDLNNQNSTVTVQLNKLRSRFYKIFNKMQCNIPATIHQQKKKYSPSNPKFTTSAIQQSDTTISKIKFTDNRSRNITDQIKNSSEIQQKKSNSRSKSKSPTQEEQNLDQHLTVPHLFSGAEDGVFAERKVDVTQDGDIVCDSDVLVEVFNSAMKTRETMIQGGGGDVAEDVIADDSDACSSAEVSGVFLGQRGCETRTGLPHRVSPIVAKPPPLLAVVFPLDRERRFVTEKKPDATVATYEVSPISDGLDGRKHCCWSAPRWVAIEVED